MRTVARKGWRPDLPDHRDHIFTKLAVQLPDKVDLRSEMPPVYDQGQIGSCTANAIAAAIQYARRAEAAESAIVPSRLFVYWNERVMEGDQDTDGGAQIRDGVKSVNKFGVCDEAEWPYEPGRLFAEPPSLAFTDALAHTVTAYKSVVQDIRHIQAALTQGYPVIFGFTVYEAFEGPAVRDTGMLDMPGPDEAVVGGHAVLAVGYDNTTQRVIVRNSWGVGWGLAGSGYFSMPYEYITNAGLASDFWVLETAV